MKVRRANDNDFPWILTELRIFDNWSGFRRSLFPKASVAEQKLRELVDGGHPVLVAELPSGALCGFMIGIIHEHFFNPEIRCCSELFWWVPERYRGTRAGALLFVE